MNPALPRAMQELAADAPAAAAVYDYQTRAAWDFDGDRWFHGASTIKIAVLAGLYAELEARELTSLQRLHVRNRFFSVLDGSASVRIAVTANDGWRKKLRMA